MADRSRVLYVGRAAQLDVDDLSVREVSSVSSALEAVDQVDCVVSAQRLEDGTGLELLRAVREGHPDLPFILYPAAEAADERVASEAISAGVTDYYRQDGTDEGELAYRIAEAVDGTRRAADRSGTSGGVAEDAEAVLGRVSDAFLALDESWRFTHINDRAAELIDVDADEIVGRNVWEEFPEATELAFYDEYHRAMESQERVSFTEHYPPLDTWFEVTAYPSETGLSVYFRDVTERIERERERERYERIVETIGDGVYALDPDGHFTFVNEAFAEMYGQSREELLGEPATTIHDEEISEWASERAAEIRTGELDQGIIEHEFRTADGEVVPVESRFRTIEYDDGEYGRVGVVRDITERRRRERELERFEALTEESTDVNAVLDEDGTFRYLTPSVERVLGYEPTELVGEQALEYIHPEDREEVEAVFFDPVEETDRPTREFRFVRADGSWAVIEATGRNLLDDPDIEGIVVYTRDITERVERERELESTAEAFHGLYDAVSDPEASFEQTIDRLLDLGREYLDVDVGMLNHIEDEVETLERVRGDHPQLQEGGEVPLERAYCRFTLDSDDHWSVHDAAAEGLSGDPAYETFGLDCYVGGVVTVGGDRYGTLCFVDDEPREPFSEVETALVDLLAQWVSFELERRALESERERLAFLNRLVRHDLLNDLNVVHARARLLDGQVAESEQPHLDLVLDRTEGMIDLVETVRSLMQAIVEDPQLESVDLGAVLREEIEAAEHTADHAEIRLLDTADVTVQADELLGQVFENLLGNAIEHGATTPLDGRQPNPLVEVSVETDAEHVTVHVADDGPGIPDDLGETALERGAKAGESAGTGVGLYLVSQLVDAYGGEVAIADNNPTGTVVSVTLPRA